MLREQNSLVFIIIKQMLNLRCGNYFLNIYGHPIKDFRNALSSETTEKDNNVEQAYIENDK